MTVENDDSLRRSREEARQFYERFTTVLLRDRLRDNPRHLWIQNLLREILRQRRFASALDVGCGIGLLTQRLRRFVPEVWGLDLSENNVRFARETVPGVEFRRADLTCETLPRRFELITAFDVLEHIPRDEKRAFLHRLMDHLTEDGWILLTIPAPEYLEYQREHAPHQLQVIDESVTSSALMTLLAGRMEIRECRSFGIDYVDQYRYYLLTFPARDYRLRALPPSWRRTWVHLRMKAQLTIRSVTHRRRYERIAGKGKEEAP